MRFASGVHEAVAAGAPAVMDSFHIVLLIGLAFVMVMLLPDV
jgi:hypothetical protein